ncbi:MAG: hypothetical protein LBJ70_02255 [Holosporales bacterium]|nr:hypothetical protein [Holosporales bacterium]
MGKGKAFSSLSIDENGVLKRLQDETTCMTPLSLFPLLRMHLSGIPSYASFIYLLSTYKI